MNVLGAQTKHNRILNCSLLRGGKTGARQKFGKETQESTDRRVRKSEQERDEDERNRMGEGRDAEATQE